ncbi:MAG: Calx-beta domain-containing protein [Verrucomicrobiota bacterium]
MARLFEWMISRLRNGRRRGLAWTMGALAAFLMLPSSAQAQTTNTNFFFFATNYFQFSSPTYTVAEDGLIASITVTRTIDTNAFFFTNFFFFLYPFLNGLSAEVNYATSDGTALANIDYEAASGTLGFYWGATSAVFNVFIHDNSFTNANKTINLRLSSPFTYDFFFFGFDDIGYPGRAVLTIEDDESLPPRSPAGQVQFSSALFSVTHEEPRAVITVTRTGGSTGRILVDYEATTNGTARVDTDFQPVKGTVVFDDFQMSTSFTVPITSRNPEDQIFFPSTNFLFGDVFVPLVLTNARPAPEELQTLAPTLGVRNANLRVIDNTAGFNFTATHYVVSETQGAPKPIRRDEDEFVGPERQQFISLPVHRSGPINEGVKVHYVVNARRIFLDSAGCEVLGGDHEQNFFPLSPGSDYATPFVDYVPPGSGEWHRITGLESASLEWAAFEVGTKNVIIPIMNEGRTEFNEDLIVRLIITRCDNLNAVVGPVGTTIVTILGDNQSGPRQNNGFTELGEQPAGALDRTWNPDFEPQTNPPFNSQPGANNTVLAVAAQPDGKLILGGEFTAVNTRPRNRIARMNLDGSLDTSFLASPNTGADAFVSALALQADGKVLLGGGFTSINGVLNRRIARLMPNGALDPQFKAGLGVDGPINAVALQSDGRLFIGGDFTSVNGTNRYNIARLNADGSLDTTFDAGAGPNGPVNSIAVSSGPLLIDQSAEGGQAEERFPIDTGSNQGTVTINYDFLQVPDTLRVYYEGNLLYDTGLVNGQGTLNVNYGPGTDTVVEIVMNEGSGLFGTIWLLSIQVDPNADPRPVIGGDFTSVNGVPRNYVARLNLDGSVDTSFNPGTGADGVVHSVAKQGQKVYMAGSFNSVDLRSRRGVARLNGNGSLDTSFDPGTGVNDTVYSLVVQSDGKPVLGGIFTSINSTRRISLARLNRDGKVDTTFMDTAYNQFAGLINPLSPDNPQSQENFIRSISLWRSTNTVVDENIIWIPRVDPRTRTNQTTITNIVARDYFYIGGRFKRVGGGFSRDNVRNRSYVARLIGDGKLTYNWTEGTNGAVFAVTEALDTPGAGNLSFRDPEYSADEDSGTLFVTLRRDNGSLGRATGHFVTEDPLPGPGAAKGGPAGQTGTDYLPLQRVPAWISTYGPRDDTRMRSDAFRGPSNDSFFVSPNDGRTVRGNPVADDIRIVIHEDALIEGDEIINLKLFGPLELMVLGNEPIPIGLALGQDKARLIIVDNDFNFGTLGFSQPEYTVNEDGRTVTITLTRVGGSAGDVAVDYATSNGTALEGPDYARSQGTLFFAAGQTNNSFTVSLVNDTTAELEETINLTLFNPTGWPTNVVPNLRVDPSRATAVLTIIDNDFAPGRLSFEQAEFRVQESGPFVTIAVRRSGGIKGEMYVKFATTNDTAVSGLNYTSTNGLLRWVDGDSSSKTFTIPILDDDGVNQDRFVNLRLFDPVIQNAPNPDALGVQPTARVRIVNDDDYGKFSFTQPVYHVDESGKSATITVVRTEGISGPVSVAVQATEITALAGTDFLPVSATLDFGHRETAKSFDVSILDDKIVEGNLTIGLLLTPLPPGRPGNPVAAELIIVDNELSNIPAGSLDTEFLASGTDGFVYALALQREAGVLPVEPNILLAGDFRFVNDVVRRRLARLIPSGALDPTFSPTLGPNNIIRSMTVENMGRIVIGGLFDNIDGINRNHVARLNIDSVVDPTFNPGAGTDNPVYATAVQTDGKVLIAGDFSTFNGEPRNAIVRLNTNGVLDAAFKPGTGANGTLYAIVVQPDGRIVIGGDFTTFNEAPNTRIARLNANGSVEAGFAVDPVSQTRLSGADASVRSIAMQSDGKILLSGLFEKMHGVAQGRLARLNRDGTVDAAFNVGTNGLPRSGANGPVNVVALQIDGKILVGGDFSRFNDVTRNRLTRLNTDGSIDPKINFGTGANAAVSTIVVQPDRKIVIGGGFTEYNGQAAKHIARIHGGAMDGAGSIEFDAPNYAVKESATNAVVTLRRIGGTTGAVSIKLSTLDLTAKAGADYVATNKVITFPEGENIVSFTVGVQDNSVVDGDRSFQVTLSEATGGATVGFQPTAEIKMLDDDSELGFSSPAYSITENFVTGSASITVTRSGAISEAVAVDFQTGTNGTATAGVDYLAQAQRLNFAPGEASKTFGIAIIDDTQIEGNETVILLLTNPSGKAIVQVGQSVLTIIDNDFAPGTLSFSAPSYQIAEGGVGATNRATITVRRSAGTTGVISVDYATSDGTATSNPEGDYQSATGILTFADGETEKSFVVNVFGDEVVEGNETATVTLSRPTGGTAIVGPNPIILTIVDDDLGAGSLDQTFNPGTGAEAGNTNAAVRALKLQADGQIVIGGDFTRFNGDLNHVRVARLNLDGSLDNTFKTTNGPNNSVKAMELSDGKVLIAGAFNTIGTIVNNRVARLSATGTFDSTFNLPLGLNAEVNTVALQPDGKVFIGGMFTGVSAAGRNRITRLNGDGNWDDSFNPGSGADYTVHSIVLQSDGKVIVGGAFATMNGSGHRGITRLHPNGVVDASFNPGTGANGTVYSVLLQKDGKIVVAGSFTAINGNTNHIRVARLNADGSLDGAFDHGLGTNKVAGVGPDNTIYAMALQEDGKIVIGGDFTQITALVTNATTKVVSSKFVSRTRIARLNQDGSLDESFDPGYGANDTVLSVAIQLDGKVLLAGEFSEVDRVSRNGLARLNGDPGLLPPGITINSVARDLANGQVSFDFVTQAGRSYVIEASTDLVNWTQKGTVSATAATAAFTDLNANPARGFYRVRRVGP